MATLMHEAERTGQAQITFKLRKYFQKLSIPAASKFTPGCIPWEAKCMSTVGNNSKRNMIQFKMSFCNRTHKELQLIPVNGVLPSVRPWLL